jgi:hypothetical protein
MTLNKKAPEFIPVSEIVDHHNITGYAVMKTLTESHLNGQIADDVFAKIGREGGAQMALLIDGVEYSPRAFLRAFERHYEVAVVERARKIIKERIADLSNRLNAIDEAIEEALKDLPGYERPERF